MKDRPLTVTKTESIFNLREVVPTKLKPEQSKIKINPNEKRTYHTLSHPTSPKSKNPKSYYNNQAKSNDSSTYDPRFRRSITSLEKNKTKSDVSFRKKKQKHNEDISVCPSTPTISSATYGEKGVHLHPKKVENKCTMTVNDYNKEFIASKDLISEIKRNRKPPKNGQPTETDFSTTSVWNDRRLLKKHSILRIPWKRTWTIPVIAPLTHRSNTTKDIIDRDTYIFDDGSETDSAFINRKKLLTPNKKFAKFETVYVLAGVVFGFLLTTSLIWFLSDTQLFQFAFKKEIEPEPALKRYVKFIGSNVIYGVTVVFRKIANVLTIPTQKIYA